MDTQNYQSQILQPEPSIPWLKLAITFKYLSNFSIIVAVLAYYMNAMPIFFVLAPLIIVNCIVIIMVQFFELDKLMTGILGEYIPDINERKTYNVQFVMLQLVWHLIGVFWLYSIMQNGLLNAYAPNGMGIFFMSSIIALVYFIVSVKKRIYGDIKYIGYMIAYVIILFSTCMMMYPLTA